MVGIGIFVFEVFFAAMMHPTLLAVSMSILVLVTMPGKNDMVELTQAAHSSPPPDLSDDATRWLAEHEAMPDFVLPGDPWHGKACTVCFPPPAVLRDRDEKEAVAKHRAERRKINAAKKALSAAEKEAFAKENRSGYSPEEAHALYAEYVQRAYANQLNHSVRPVYVGGTAPPPDPSPDDLWIQQVANMPMSQYMKHRQALLTASTGPR